MTDSVIKIEPKRDAITAGLLVFAIAASCAFLVYLLAATVLKSELRDYLRDIAKTAALLTDAEAHKRITLPEHKDSEEYLKIQQTYQKIIYANPQIKYIYTLVLRDDKPYFVVDSQTASDKAEEAPAEVMEAYPDWTVEMMEALVSQTAHVENETYTDKWGTFLSGYAPFYDSENRFVGVVGADMHIEQYQLSRTGITVALYLGLALAAVLALIVAYIVLEIRTAHKIEQERLLKQIQNNGIVHRH